MEDEKIKVLHISGTMGLGGQETLIMNVLRNIDKNKFEFDFVVHSEERGFYDDEIEALGGKIHRITPMSKSLIKHCKELANVIKTGDYKIVHRHTASSIVWIDLFVAKLCKVKLRIAHSHSTSNSTNKLLESICRPLLNVFSNKKYACSDEAGKFLFGKNANYEIVWNGIDLEKFKYSKEKRIQKRKELNIDENAFVIGHVGRFDTQKNHMFLLEIFKAYVEKYDSKAKLLLIGNGDLKEIFEKKAKEYKLQDNIIILSNRNDVNELMTAMDVFVFPSLHEGLGIALVEAQTEGLNCIISDTIPDEAVFIDKLCKRVILKESPSKWADEIKKCEKNSRENAYNEMLKTNMNISNTVKFLSSEYKKELK